MYQLLFLFLLSMVPVIELRGAVPGWNQLGVPLLAGLSGLCGGQSCAGAGADSLCGPRAAMGCAPAACRRNVPLDSLDRGEKGGQSQKRQHGDPSGAVSLCGHPCPGNGRVEPGCADRDAARASGAQGVLADCRGGCHRRSGHGDRLLWGDRIAGALKNQYPGAVKLCGSRISYQRNG